MANIQEGLSTTKMVLINKYMWTEFIIQLCLIILKYRLQIIDLQRHRQMRKLNIFNPQEIEQQLRLFCEIKPKQCAKQNSSGWGSNKRILIVSNDRLQYYNYNSQFKQNDPYTINPKYLKASILLEDIQEINYLPEDNSQKNIMLITMLSRKIYKNIKSKKKQQPKTIKKDFNNNQNKNIKQSQQENSSNYKKISFGSQIFESQNLQQINYKKDNKNIQSWKFYFTYDVKNFIDKRKKEIIEKKKNQTKIQKIQNNDFKLQPEKQLALKRLSQVIKKSDKNNLDLQSYILSIKNAKLSVIQKQDKEIQATRKKKRDDIELQTQNFTKQQPLIHTDFWRRYFKLYEEMQKSKSTGFVGIQKQLNFLEEIQIFKNAVIEIVQKYINETIIGRKITGKTFEKYTLYQGIWIKIGEKELNQEYLANQWLADIIYNMDGQQKMKFRLPLMLFIEYKTIKALCMCDMPFSQIDKSEVYNLSSDSYDLLLMAKLKQYLQQFEIMLNIKSQPILSKNNNKTTAPLGRYLRIFEYNGKNDFKVDTQVISSFYYLTNINNLFPLDPFSLLEQKQTHYRLRPELVNDYQQSLSKNCQLLSQAFMLSNSLDEEIKNKQDGKVLAAMNHLKDVYVPLLVSHLDFGKFIIIDSYSIKQIFSEIGINMRYMHLIVEQSYLPYVKQLLTVQSLARTIKKLFRGYIQDIFKLNVNNRKVNDWHEIEQIINQNDVELAVYAIDFLNLIFGNGIQSIQYWKIIIENCQLNYKIKVTYPPLVKPGSLLHAILWNCSFNITFTKNIRLFNSFEPFTMQNWIQFDTKCKVFDFPSLKISKIVRNTIQDTNDQNNQAPQVNFWLQKLQHLLNQTLYGNTFKMQVTLSKMNKSIKNIKKPQLKVSLHPCQISHYITNKSSANFQKALNIMDFSLPNSHPLYITLYEEYSTMFEKQLLIKTAIMLSVKCFGQFHERTTKMYAKYHKMGYKQFQIEAQRDTDIFNLYKTNMDMFQDRSYQTCIRCTLNYIKKYDNNQLVINSTNIHQHVTILQNGLNSATEIFQLDQALKISAILELTFKSFELKDYSAHFQFFKQILKIKLLRISQKNYLFRITQLLIQLQKKYQLQTMQFDKQGQLLESSNEEREKIIEVILSEYYLVGTHSEWIQYLLKHITSSYKYFYYIPNFQQNFKQHLALYPNAHFKNCLAGYQLLIRLYGQKLFRQNLYEITPVEPEKPIISF